MGKTYRRREIESEPVGGRFGTFLRRANSIAAIQRQGAFFVLWICSFLLVVDFLGHRINIRITNLIYFLFTMKMRCVDRNM